MKWSLLSRLDFKAVLVGYNSTTTATFKTHSPLNSLDLSMAVRKKKNLFTLEASISTTKFSTLIFIHSWESLIKDQSIFSLVIIWLILVTISLDNVSILLKENWWWSLLGLKGLTGTLNVLKPYNPGGSASYFHSPGHPRAKVWYQGSSTAARVLIIAVLTQ